MPAAAALQRWWVHSGCFNCGKGALQRSWQEWRMRGYHHLLMTTIDSSLTHSFSCQKHIKVLNREISFESN
ncbi:unnamed protein product [Victoria cruziana]